MVLVKDMKEGDSMLDNSCIFDVIRYYEKNSDGREEFREGWNEASEKMIFARLERAMGNLNSEQGIAPATHSRFAIWAADIIWLLDESIKEMKLNHIDKAEELMYLTKRSMCAYLECCRLNDTQDGFMKIATVEEILSKYSFTGADT